MAGAKGFWGDAFPCALLRFHTIHPPSSSPQVLRSWSSLQPPLGGGAEKHKQDIVMHLGVKTYLKCLRGFQRKHSNVGIFFFPPAELCFVLCGTLRQRRLCRCGKEAGGRRSSTAPPPHRRQHPPWLSHYVWRADLRAGDGFPRFQGSLQCSDYCGNKEQWGGQRLLWHSECVSIAG